MTQSNYELKIPWMEYNWQIHFKENVTKNLFNKNVEVNRNKTALIAKQILQEEGIDDNNTWLGLAAILSGKLDELKVFI